jgi:group II intron reverse transcriptase/maturase
MMYGLGESDESIVPAKSPNNAVEAAEAMEGSDSTKGNLRQQNTLWTQGQQSVQSALRRIRGAATSDRRKRFTCLYHHVYNVSFLREAFLRLRKDAAAGVDGETWRQYEEGLEGNLQALSTRLRLGGYHAKPVRRVYIPKLDGRMRPLGVPALEDKIVQRATVAVLNAIYEVDFAPFSYGFRPGRSQHRALDALRLGLMKRVSWVLDADIRGFFDSINHDWLIRFVEHRIADRRVVRLIQKWLRAGVLEDGEWRQSEEGTPQGGSISPLLANIYLHYTFDLWVQQWRRMPGRGTVIVVRWADDFVLGFQHRWAAEMFQEALRARLAKFHLELHPEKTRLVEFGRFATENRARRGDGKPETFSFLGFTHICGRSRAGKHTIWRQTERKRMRAKLQEVKAELRRRLHRPVPVVGRWLASLLRGHYAYYGVSYNSRALGAFRHHVSVLWYRTLRRRSQRTRLTWERMRRLIEKWLPPARLRRSDFWPTQLVLPTVT